MPSIKLENVSLVRDGIVGLNDVSLEIGDREFVAVVGPSGAGKSSFLRVVAGLEFPTSGRLFIDDVDVGRIEPKDRDVAMVFQEHALYSHKTAEGNLGFPLDVRHVGEPERSIRIGRTARAMGLVRLLARRPRTLSVGQRNAVATGRALVRDPKILLMDEPLANLDAKSRVRTRVEIRQRHEQSEATTIYATNDQSEAMAVGDRVVVLNRGAVQQFASPTALYDAPANLAVARFIGSPTMSVMSGTLEPEYPDYVWSAGDDRLVIPTRVVELHPGLHYYMGGQVMIGLRSENIRPAVNEPFASCLHGVCTQIEDQGSDRFAHFDLGYGTAVARLIDGGRVPGLGNPTELFVRTDRLHFFDPHSGSALSRS